MTAAVVKEPETVKFHSYEQSVTRVLDLIRAAKWQTIPNLAESL